jgi:hypothetical protein
VGASPLDDRGLDRPRARRSSIALAAATLAAIWLTAPAAAHDESSWIMANPLTRHCCGPADCAPLDRNDVLSGPLGWTVLRYEFQWPDNGTAHASIDDRFWWCWDNQRRPKCFFRPAIGS